MRIGMFIGDLHGPTTADELAFNARDAESRGFATGWVPHAPWSLDALSGLTVAAGSTSRLELGTAVVPTYVRHPLNMAQHALSVQAISNGRLALGIGPSHRFAIERMYGLTYESPAAHTREYVQALTSAFAGGHVTHDGTWFRFKSKLDVPGDPAPPSLLVAALAPRMLAVAGELADGTITYWADQRAVAEHIVPNIRAAAQRAGRSDPRVIVGLPIAICDDADAVRDEAATLFKPYQSVPAYQRILKMGFSSEPVEVAVIGDEKSAAAQLRAYEDAGATDFCAAVMALGADRIATRRRTLDFLSSCVK